MCPNFLNYFICTGNITPCQGQHCNIIMCLEKKKILCVYSICGYSAHGHRKYTQCAITVFNMEKHQQTDIQCHVYIVGQEYIFYGKRHQGLMILPLKPQPNPSYSPTPFLGILHMYDIPGQASKTHFNVVENKSEHHYTTYLYMCRCTMTNFDNVLATTCTFGPKQVNETIKIVYHTTVHTFEGQAPEWRTELLPLHQYLNSMKKGKKKK